MHFFNQEEGLKLKPYIAAIVEFRDVIRRAALSRDMTAVTTACESLKDKDKDIIAGTYRVPETVKAQKYDYYLVRAADGNTTLVGGSQTTTSAASGLPFHLCQSVVHCA